MRDVTVAHDLSFRGDFDCDGVAPRVTSYLDTLRIVQSEILRFACVKVWRCIVLITGFYSHTGHDKSPGIRCLLSDM